jgi:hypothetical protein
VRAYPAVPSTGDGALFEVPWHLQRAWAVSGFDAQVVSDCQARWVTLDIESNNAFFHAEALRGV